MQDAFAPPSGPNFEEGGEVAGVIVEALAAAFSPVFHDVRVLVWSRRLVPLGILDTVFHNCHEGTK